MDPERSEKQRVVVDLEVSERENITIDHYQNVVRRISDVSLAQYYRITNSYCCMMS